MYGGCSDGQGSMLDLSIDALTGDRSPEGFHVSMTYRVNHQGRVHM